MVTRDEHVACAVIIRRELETRTQVDTAKQYGIAQTDVSLIASGRAPSERARNAIVAASGLSLRDFCREYGLSRFASEVPESLDRYLEEHLKENPEAVEDDMLLRALLAHRGATGVSEYTSREWGAFVPVAHSYRRTPAAKRSVLPSISRFRFRSCSGGE